MTSFWHDLWLEGGLIFSIFRRLYNLSLDKKVFVVSMCVDQDGYKIEVGGVGEYNCSHGKNSYLHIVFIC